ncbi:hypothetical protein chiPu_0007027 [Chiloscyllium punctatum]|uniref:Cilia- and flagella-associated protein 58 central coiled coil domain-containing protein n=1 Tax=Chiloscyllium punctatum TaxID=137246 RepID=A0A401SDW3_CHIPU|nr:hypothetical protein [Chiloscyllium punctatum]
MTYRFPSLLFSAGKIAGTQIGHLKSKYILLHEALRRTQESEVKLLQDAKLFTAELEHQRQELEKADQFPDSYDTEVNKLRQQLLHCQNELNQTEERISRQKHRTVYLQEELEMFKKDFERLPKAADFERKTKALREGCIELSREITQRKREIKTTKEELESKIEEVKNMQQELEKKQENEEHLKLDLVQLHTVPVQLAKDIQKLNRKRNNLEKAKAEIDAQYNKLLVSVQQIENKCRMVEDEKLEVMKELDEKRALLDSKEQEHNQLVKTVELGKENESTLMGQRASLDLHLRYIQTEKKILSDTVVVKQREKDRELRKAKKKEKQLKSSVDALAYAEFSYEKIKAQVESFPIGGAFLERRNELENEVKSLKRKLADQTIKNERNKYVNLIQSAAQISAEMREKIKILQNEMEILRTTTLLKDSQLQKYKLKHSNSHVIRDSLRRAICKIDQVLRELGEKREGQKIKIVKLSSLINQAEEEMIQLRKKYENVVQVRNERGIHLIEREEEVCIFYEKLSIQDSLISNGDVELHSMEDEIRFLNILLKEENRQIEKVRKDVPSKHEMESNLITLQKELALYQDKVQSLEKTLVDPSCENRSRLLGGDDPSFEELSKRIEEMDLKLVRKEEQLLEKDLITDQVTRLSERINAKAINGKQDTLTLAKKVNEMQGKVKDVTRKMMAVVSELSMQQANAMQLQQDVKDKQQFLELCCQRMEQGMAPSEEFESEWLKLVDKENRHKREMEMKNKETEEEEKHLLPGGVFTTAEPRPNAYIPDGDSGLPIPRPYGKMVPFKPSEPSAHMRHYRKPVIKPIEI